jgi:putative membrane protein
MSARGEGREMKQDDSSEKEPDVRFSFANERTLLAWNRTALALIATGIDATPLLPTFHVAESDASPGEPLPRSPMPFILASGILVVGVIGAVLAALGGR